MTSYTDQQALIQQVLDKLIDFLYQKDQERELTQAALRTAEASFNRVWDNVMCDFQNCTSPSKSSGCLFSCILSHTQMEWVSILVVHRLCRCHASRTWMAWTWKRWTNWA